MKKRFKEIRVFYGNEYVGHNYCRVEFVFDNTDFQNRLMKLSGDPRVHCSRSKTGEVVFDASVNQGDFIYALKDYCEVDEIKVEINGGEFISTNIKNNTTHPDCKDLKSLSCNNYNYLYLISR